ncbi:MAG: HAMP domain-containing histidine kinase, partial [Ruminococcus sp.]|nr:HAMP domain-containing histidine kinase [Ruminococcus sp.]
MVYGLLGIIIIALCVKIYLMKRSAREIANEFADRLQTDTNTLIDISSHDKDMLYLADSINKQLRILRKEHLQYHQGDTELKNAITNISHDLRTPLTAITGNLYMIGKTDELSEIREYVGAIEERTEAMKQLTEELFRYSIIASGDSEAVTEEVFINQVLAESISSFYPVLTEKGITPQIHITDNRIVRNINRSDLMRVFSNLLNNAVKYSDGDLAITLSDSGEITF